MSWAETTLGEHIDLISGPAFKSVNFSEDNNDVPLIKGENIAQGYIAWEKSRYWPRSNLDGLEKYWLEDGDIVLAMDRPWIPAGLKWAEIQSHNPRSLLVQRVARIRANEGLEPRFLKYVIASNSFSEYLRNIMYGVNVPHISGKQIRAFSFLLPEPMVQKSIAETLSAYDDLIENNRRRIALLEEVARLLYREWFVHFRFPGAEHVKIVDGVPEGWERKPFDQLAEFLNGFAFKPYHLGEHGLPIVKIPELKNGVTDKTPYYDGNDVPEKYLLKTGDLIFSWSGTLAVDYWINGDGYLNQHLFKVTPQEKISSAFLLIAIREAMPRFLNQAVGATMKHIRRSALVDVDFFIPPESIFDDFLETVDVQYAQIRLLRQQNAQLAKARDLLLPRLMDGRLEI